MDNQPHSRRQFIQQSAAVAAFTIVPSYVLGGSGRRPPSETIRLGAIGIGGVAVRDIKRCRQAGARIEALCDVDLERGGETFKAYPRARQYRDYRRMLDKEKGLDAVLVATPDHVHAVATMAVMQRGKHVFCEKPLARTLHEVRTVTEAAKRYGVVTQLGNQGHASEHIRRFCEWIWSDAIGSVKEIHAFCGSSYGVSDTLYKLKERPPVPSTLDWDLWLGPVPYRPYHSLYVPSNWRRFFQFGTGVIGDWICHVVDPVYWALDLGAPETVEAEVGDFDPKAHAETFPKDMRVTYRFPAKGRRSALTLYWYTHREPPRPADLEEGRRIPRTGAFVIGEKGTIMYGSHGAGDCIIVPQKKMMAFKRPKPWLKRSPGHYKEWVDACKTGQPSPAGFHYGGPLTEIALLGVIAARFPGQKLTWDSKGLKFTNNEAANAFIKPVYREGWSLGS